MTKHKANLLVTEENIDDVARTIRTDHVDLMVACDLLQLDTESVLKLRTEGMQPDSEGLARYTYDELRKADAQAEAAILKQLHDPDGDPQFGKLLLNFLERTKSRYSPRHKTNMIYELNALVEYTKRFVPDDRKMEWITGLMVMSGVEMVLALDEKLLK